MAVKDRGHPILLLYRLSLQLSTYRTYLVALRKPACRKIDSTWLAGPSTVSLDKIVLPYSPVRCFRSLRGQFDRLSQQTPDAVGRSPDVRLIGMVSTNLN
jgi:hypothetical protein